MPFLELIGLTGTLVFTIYFLLGKWGLLDQYDMRRKDWMMERCDFCFMFWLCVIVDSIIYMSGVYDLILIYYILAPFCSVSIAYALSK